MQRQAWRPKDDRCGQSALFIELLCYFAAVTVNHIMTLVASISRFAKVYVFSPEAFILCILLLLLYNSFLHVKPLLKFANRARVKLQLKLRGQYDVIPERSETDVSEEQTKASWELKKENVAVFAIQGRRPHMEDRFNVVIDLEHTDTSIYGIFDGHGGEV